MAVYLKETKSYQESSELSGYVIDLQKFDRILKTAVKKGTVKVVETKLMGINKYFEI